MYHWCKYNQISRTHLFDLFIVYFVAFAAAAITPRQIVWSEKAYGPDGPWQAVTVNLGTPPQSVDLFPGGFWASNILEASICNSTGQQPVCYAQAAGLYNSSASSSSVSYSETGGFFQNTSLYPIGNVIPPWGSMEYKFDRIIIYNSHQDNPELGIGSFDMFVLFEAYFFLPDGSIYPMEVGNLALGAPDFNQTWAQGDGLPNINGTFLPSGLYATGEAESNSWGLHIGSVALGIPGSLYIGGYDQTRVLEPVSVQTYGIDNLPIDLLDISIGVAEGQSPFTFTSKSGLLAQGNSSIVDKLGVDIDATMPYLYLPQSTCDAISENLPVTYQPKYGLYFWDTTSSLYQQIISSPAFLSFTFRLNGSIAQNMTINVPFALLNLTLTAPLVSGSVQYFPCNPVSRVPSADNSPYALGKAFLQAAFVGVNWQTNSEGCWFLAQAPGPNTPTVPIEVAIEETDNYIVPSQNSWAETWKGAWTPIGTTAGNVTSSSGSSTGTNTPTPTSAPTKASLSAGATAGIGVGCALVAGILFITTFYYIRKRWNRSRTPTSNEVSPTSDKIRPDYKGGGGFGPREMQSTKDPVEIGSSHREFGRYSRPRTLNHGQPFEMQADGS